MNHYDTIFGRIKENSDIKTQVDLARALGFDQSAVSHAKGKGTFPYNWAVRVCLKFNLSMDLIIRGIPFDFVLEAKSKRSFHRIGEKGEKEISAVRIGMEKEISRLKIEGQKRINGIMEQCAFRFMTEHKARD